MTDCFYDWETRSPVPIHFGTLNYRAKVEPLILTYGVDNDKVKLWDTIGGEPKPKEVTELERDPDVLWIAHNNSFDRRMNPLVNINVPIHRMRCTRAQAYAHGLPGSLETLGKVLGLSDDEQKFAEDGQKLIRLFCIPQDWNGNQPIWATRYTHPVEWERFCLYGIQDTEALRHVYRRLPTHNYRGDNLRLWHLDQVINDRGFGFDDELAWAARDVLDRAKKKNDVLVDITTNGAAQTATQRKRLLDWFNSSGLKIASMKAAEIREYLEHDDIDPMHRFMLELRLDAAKSSGSKYKRGLELMNPDRRIRDAIQYGGAGRTGRFSGKGYQPHNMPRPVTGSIDKKGRRITIPVKWPTIEGITIPGIKRKVVNDFPELYGSANECCANALRGAIVAAPGNELVVADWSNIESRVLAWICDELWKLASYFAADAGEGVDAYKQLFSSFFGTPIDEINDQQRQSGKVVELACGFNGSVGALVAMAAAYNMDLDDLVDVILPNAPEPLVLKARKAHRRAMLSGEDYALEPKTFIACHVLVQMYRKANHGIQATIRELDKATKEAVKNTGTLFQVAKCKVWSNGHYLIIELPSGRRLLYSQPRIWVEREKDMETGKVTEYESVTYMTARGKQWRREKAWSGLFIENIVQAIANDVLRAGLLHVHDWSKTQPQLVAYLMSLPVEQRTIISLHVHDEVSCDVPKGSMQAADLIRLLTTDLLDKHTWMRGLPLAATGWVGPRYHK